MVMAKSIMLLLVSQDDFKNLSEYCELKLVVGKDQLFLPHDILIWVLHAASYCASYSWSFESGLFLL